MELAANCLHGNAVEGYLYAGIIWSWAMSNRLCDLRQWQWIDEAGQSVGIQIRYSWRCAFGHGVREGLRSERDCCCGR